MCNQNNFRVVSGGCCHCSNGCNQKPFGGECDDFLTPIVRVALFVFFLLLILSAL